MAFSKAPLTFKAGAAIKDLNFPWKQRLLTHMREQEDGDAVLVLDKHV
jgi:hypothetical protein